MRYKGGGIYYSFVPRLYNLLVHIKTYSISEFFYVKHIYKRNKVEKNIFYPQ